MADWPQIDMSLELRLSRKRIEGIAKNIAIKRQNTF